MSSPPPRPSQVDLGAPDPWALAPLPPAKPRRRWPLPVVSLALGIICALLVNGLSSESQPNGGPALLLARDAGDRYSAAEIYRRSADAVAFISAEGPEGKANGSGFLISDSGEILTNAHVVDGASEITVNLGGGKQREAVLRGSDPATDLALLQVEDLGNVEPLPLGNADQLVVGDQVVAIGNPFGLDRTLTTGVVSALRRQIVSPDGTAQGGVIQTDASINPGNSGGPLIDASGRVIGINSQIASATNSSAGIGFAIPINTAAGMLEELREGEVRHGYLGVSGQTQLGPEGGKRGVEVISVEPAIAAEIAGIRPGDVLTAVDDVRVRSIEGLQIQISGHRAGDQIIVHLRRGERQLELEATLSERPLLD